MTHKSYKHTRIYHPLKKRKINLNKIQFAFDVSIENLQKAIKTLETSDTPVLSKRYFVTSGVKKSNWSHEKEIIDWLISVNIDVARLDSDKFLIKNKVYSFNMVLILANKKRRELGFRPFYVDGITEH
ncbi:MAG: hypothetical protein LBB21_02880 [Holosporaceae bacterium]|jgi:hypothetical protein|nr:hypothetical protein [Holosporaceae bacterium]